MIFILLIPILIWAFAVLINGGTDFESPRNNNDKFTNKKRNNERNDREIQD